MERFCPCGKQIRVDRRLCGECAEIYGTDPKEWPEWLRWQVNDIQRELDCERNNEQLSLESIEPNGRGGYRAKREFALRGCRNETHLYQEREQHGG